MAPSYYFSCFLIWVGKFLHVPIDVVMFFQLPGSKPGKVQEAPCFGHLQGINRTEQRRSSSCSRQENPLLIPQEQQSIFFFFPQTTSLFSTCFSEYCVFMIQFLKCQGCTTRHPYVRSPHPYCTLRTALLPSEPIITAVKPCWR